MLKTTKLKLVTIVCETLLIAELIELVRKLGASGFTIVHASGEGTGEKNTGEITGSKMKIEVIAARELAEKIMNEVAGTYFKDFSIILYSTDIDVIRPEKF